MRPHLFLILLLMSAPGIGASASEEVVVTNAPSAVVTNAAPAAAVTSPTTGTNFDSFRIVAERNIFNQNRSTRSARRESSRPRSAPVVQALSLVGTLSYEKGDFAFFEGTSPEFKKPVKPGEKIAGYEVKEIKATCVKIANEKQEFEIKVGQQLRREDQGEWQLSSSSSRVTQNPTNSQGTTEGATSSTGTASEDEAMRRLMEKRAKEMNQ
jgi:hypothetical protein